MRVQKLALLLACLVGAGVAQAATAFYDLNTAPDPAQFSLVGSAEWVDAGGVNNSGCIKLTDNTGQSCAVLFPDFDQGLVVAAFTFECKIKCGDWYGNPPADGFSVNYARGTDPIIPLIDSGVNPGRGGREDGWAGSFYNGGNEDNLPEEGTKTGIAIGFDTWGTGNAPVGGSNGPNDVRGISVVVDGNQFTQIAMPSVAFADGDAHDFEHDATTLITGPFTCGSDPNFPPGYRGDPTCQGGMPPATGEALKWVPLKVTVDAAGKVNVWWKGTQIVTDLATPYGPGPGRIIFGASTGGAMEYAAIDDISITTVPSVLAIYSTVVVLPTLDGFVAHIADSGQSIVEQASAQLVFKYDGNDVTPTSWVKTGGDSAITYILPGGAFLASGSQHTVEIQAKDTQGNAITGGTKSFTTPTYATIGPEMAVVGVDKTKPGFLVRSYQVYSGQPNGNVKAELMLHGQLGDNLADTTVFTLPVGPNSYYEEEVVINLWDTGGQGNFPNDTQNVPGLTTEPDNNQFAVEILTFLEFPKAGLYKFGVNSDDGFRTYVGLNPLDWFQLGSMNLGEYNGGRGVGDTPYYFMIAAPGIYPFRTIWEEGGGGAACEWFSQDVVTGTRVLINDTATDPNAIKAYRKGPWAQRAYISAVGGGNPVDVEVTDGSVTKLVAGSAKLKLDGSPVTPVVSTAGGKTTISANVRPSTYWVEVSYDENTTPPTTRTAAFRARVLPKHLSAQTFVIEAEDFDYDGGKANPLKGVAGSDVDVMPYYGGAYADLGAVLNVDYYNADANDSQTYRMPLMVDPPSGNNCDISDAFGGQLGRERPGWEVMANHRIGWVAGSDWQNYTRNIPAGTYEVYAALSYDGTSAHQLNAVLSQVTAGAGTPNQTVQQLGVFDGFGTAEPGIGGGWGRNDLAPLKASDGSALPVKLAGGTMTLRVTLGSGDFDYFMLVPDTTKRAQIVSAIPTGQSTAFYSRNDITVVIQDFATKCVKSSIKLMLDGNDVTADANISQAGDLTTVKYNAGPGVHSYTLSFTDDGTPPLPWSYTASWKAGPLPVAGAFAIEAEDFNYDGGKSVAAASVMPYLGNAYAGLGATMGVDYQKDDDNSSDVYRTEKDAGGQNAVNINSNLGGVWGADRGAWSVTTNYKIGWIGGGQWFNFTRDIPAGSYEVWAALSFDGTAASQLSGGLARVTSDPSLPEQTTENLGVFDAPGTNPIGGWGANDLVPLTDTAGGSRVVINAGPATTLRYNASSGDFDWFVLVPSEGPPPPPKITKVQANKDGTVTIEWENGGTLEYAPTVLGPWTPVPGQGSPFTFQPPAKVLFGRIKR